MLDLFSGQGIGWAAAIVACNQTINRVFDWLNERRKARQDEALAAKVKQTVNVANEKIDENTKVTEQNARLAEEIKKAVNGKWDKLSDAVENLAKEVSQLRAEKGVLWETVTKMTQQADRVIIPILKALHLEGLIDSAETVHPLPELAEAVREYQERHPEKRHL